ncbi:MAG: hypothetical protein HQL23_04735 [Candidatus Omnitrophica bacterium]|nr:hypothetical protein [Candidatus Omnitrophota bacterium]
MTMRDWLALFQKHSDIKIFHMNHLKLLTTLNDHALRVALYRMNGNQTVKRICRGFYANPFNLPTLEEISGQIYQPSYISLESALASYGLLSQLPRTLTCVTTRLPRTFRTTFGVIAYRQMKGEYFWGSLNRGLYALAQKEKAAADYIYLTPPKKRAETLSAIFSAPIDRQKLISCFSRLGMKEQVNFDPGTFTKK